jgi:hypothetical protein
LAEDALAEDALKAPCRRPLQDRRARGAEKTANRETAPAGTRGDRTFSTFAGSDVLLEVRGIGQSFSPFRHRSGRRPEIVREYPKDDKGTRRAGAYPK